MKAVEVMISIVILGLVVSGLAFAVKGVRAQSYDFGESTSCDQLSSGIVGAIKAYDNALVVRNWIQSSRTSFSVAQVGLDPFCNTANGRTPVCDSFRLFSLLNGTSYVDSSNVQTFQNIRGAYTWAQALYNQYRNSGICTMPGMTVSARQLREMLPAQMNFPSWIRDFHLYIKDNAIACGQHSTSMRSQLDLYITARYGGHGNPIESCAAALAITTPNDSTRPQLSVQAIRNLAGDSIPPGACTDVRTVPQVIAAGGPGTDWQNIYTDLYINEPGSLLTCRKAGAFEMDPPGRFRNCPDMPVTGQLSILPNDSTISYNVPLQARIQMENMEDRGQDLHIYEYKALDVGGNESPVVTTSFRVHTPICIDPSLYCPNANPAIPPASAFEDITVQPYDDCLNGLCPQGTRRYCDPAQQATVCAGQSFLDDCGLPTCTGSMAGSCAGVDLTVVPCGTTAFGTCGVICGLGQANCTPTPPPTPPPGCNCNAVDVSTLACNTFADDSCGNTGICGPGTMNCTNPTPAPFTGNWGPYQCTRRNGTQTCVSNQFVPSGYTTYRITFYFLGQRLDNEPHDSTVRARLSFGNAAPYSSQATGWGIGPYNGPHAAMPGIPGGTMTVTVPPGAPAPILTISLFVEDSSIQAFWQIDATVP